MGKKATKDCSQYRLFCDNRIDDQLPKNHIVYFFDRIIDGLNLSSFYDQYSREGGRAYSPKTLLKVLLYGYFKGLRSSRKLSEACINSCL